MGAAGGFVGLVAGEAGETPSAVPLSRRLADVTGVPALRRKAARPGLKPRLPQSFVLFDRQKHLRQASEPLVRFLALFGRKIGTMAVEDPVAGPALGFWNHSGQSESPLPLWQGSG